MLKFILKHSLVFAILLFNVSQCFNAIEDYIKFHSVDADQIWHIMKWWIDRPCLFLSGVLSFETIKEQFKNNDIWHYTNRFLYLLAGIVFSFFLWQIIYRSL